MNRPISRAQFLRAMAGTALAWPLLLKARAAESLLKLEKPLMPVKVSPSRVIRTVVGLRPYRASGFNLKAQSFGHKTLVHNYGHGAGGFSLSWGCAALAADLIAGRTPHKAAVIGAGIIGLTTARTLQDRGWAVTIYAEHLPPDTTSNIAGAQWKPSSVFDDDEIAPEFLPKFRQAARIANKAFQLQVGQNYGVHWQENYYLYDDVEAIEESHSTAGIQDLYIDRQKVDPTSTPFAAARVHRYTTMLMEPNIYLPAILRDFYIRGGRIVVRKFTSQNEWHKLPENIIFNCTGLGARALIGDTNLIPVRGQLTVLEPQSEVDYAVLKDSLYMFPRADGIVLGGTWNHNNWSLEPDLETQARILNGHAALYRA